MAEGDHVDISEEVNPLVPTLSQPPPTRALPPLTPAGVLPAYSGALPTHPPPPASSGAPLPPASLTSAATDDQARIAALEGMAPPPINTTFHEPGTPTHAASSPRRRISSPRLTPNRGEGSRGWKKRYGPYKWVMFVPTHATATAAYSRDSLSGSALDWFMSLKAEDIPTWEDLSRKFIDQYRYCAETPPTLLELSTKEMAQGQRGVYYSHLLAHTSSFSDLIEAGKKLDLGIKLGRMEGPVSKGEESSKKVPATSSSSSGRRGKEVSVNAVNMAQQASQQTSQPTQRVPPPQGQQGGAAQPRLRRQYPALPVPISHIYRQIRDKIGTTAPDPSFDPTIQDQSKQCEYHRGAPGHTLDNYWKLRERIQDMIDAKELVFNAVRFAGIGAPPAPFVINIPVREPYSDDRVPWTYEKGVGNLEQQLNVMGVTRSGRLYENPATTDKGKAPAVEVEAMLRAPPSPPKKVTEEEAEAFMKIIRASEYKKLKFIVEERIITVKGEEDYAIYKETAVPYISVGNDENLPFHSFETISIIRDYGEVGPSRADRMIGKAHRGNHLHRLATHYGRLNRGILVPPLSHFFPGPPLIIGSTSDGPSSNFDDTADALPTMYAVTEDIPSGVHMRPAQENEELNNWTSVLRYSTVIACRCSRSTRIQIFDMLIRTHPKNVSESLDPYTFGEGLDEDSLVPEIEESLRRLEDRQLTSL
ncbi:hypothetical protein CRG98_013099 [Punica granatum]|uniref:Retrotransposon gag domain-containing protein n=1 Tax=Punica granatum TaxID=22663 RepID=A0A2I0KFB6_PUNGR|nr:hypothetical protein CRG98_013099 [Punica granatum]